MITLFILLLFIITILITVLIGLGVLTLSYWWVLLIGTDIAIAILLIKGICKIFKRKKK